MKKITLEMPVVRNCMASECAYNVNSACHARAITIGDATHPGCDTFLKGLSHIRQIQQIAGIGACKTSICKFNEDLECMADNIQVGMIKSEANCMTFALR
ncbi:MAG: hypothetical protein A3F73_01200 [Gallionellales bacterium RIFCSPLOWO2_12_FULL_59_22]|nr:MAG: hypothetical protein A3H99_10125 [Gallionellales bacterium RIFCSPLOWO2_02_FULL_59_110]OGT04732.1 MAG: hypothetical protein A2Z65_10430 [Gallionellales bacterium RIFCSPLOWO2_02_58_13]OGT12929.1 MAG: hypothetical protein A3F73_01200 [Gallionellales bacterium RIFCSPLOWO2_12_FULL_59_22]